MSEEKDKFWEIVDGVEINPVKIKFFTHIYLWASQITGLILLIISISTTPILGILGFIIALYGLNKFFEEKYNHKIKEKVNEKRK